MVQTTQSMNCVKRDAQWHTRLNIAVLHQYIGDRISTRTCREQQQPPSSSKLFYFRIFASVYCIAILAWNLSRFIRLNCAQFWLIFLSQWVGILSSLYFVSVSVFHRQLLRYVCPINVRTTEAATNAPAPPDQSTADSANLQQKFGSCYRATRWLFAVSFSSALSVTLSNWLLNTNYATYVRKGNADDIEKCLNSIHLHGVIFMLLFVDYFMSLSYLTYASCVWPALLGAVYTVWSAIHYAANISNPWHTRYIYPLLNWRHPLTASVTCLGIIVCNLVFHVVLAWAKYKFMLCKWSECGIGNRDTKQVAPQVPQPDNEPPPDAPTIVRVQSASQHGQATNGLDSIVVTDADGNSTKPMDKMAYASNEHAAIDASYESNVSEQCTTSEAKDVNDSLEMTSTGATEIEEVQL